MFGGYEHYSFKQYKTEVIAEAQKQQIITENTNKWNDQVIKETHDAYQKRMANIDTKYGRLYDHGTSAVPNTNTKQNSTVSNGSTANDVPIEINLPRDCAITTNMLVTLQEILKTTKDQP